METIRSKKCINDRKLEQINTVIIWDIMYPTKVIMDLKVNIINLIKTLGINNWIFKHSRFTEKHITN